MEGASATPVLALEMMFTSFQGWQLIKMSHKMHLQMKKPQLLSIKTSELEIKECKTLGIHSNSEECLCLNDFFFLLFLNISSGSFGTSNECTILSHRCWFLQLKLFYQYERHVMMKTLQDVHSLLLDDGICSITTPPRIVGGVGIRTGWVNRRVKVNCNSWEGAHEAQYFSAL